MEITSDTTRIRLAAFQLEGEAQVWWNWAKTSRDLEAMTWAEFQELFMGKYFPDTARHAKAQEFLELKQGTMTMMDYVARFTKLARFADEYVAADMAKVRRFENRLKLSIRGRIVGLRLQDLDSMVGTALTIERESRMLEALGKLAGLLPSCVTIQWKLYHDLVGWKAGLAWGEALSHHM